MEIYLQSKIKGSFKGWNRNHIFELINGTIWLQIKYKYQYKYRYRPEAIIFRDGSKYYIQVEGMNDMIEVKKISRSKAEEIMNEANK
jgi:hypothetical protein